MEGKIRIAGTVGESIVDGPGFRYTLFVQGCPHGCPGCHNPQTHDFEGGQDIELDTLLKDMCRNPFIKGVTFSGGRAVLQGRTAVSSCGGAEAQGQAPDGVLGVYV